MLYSIEESIRKFAHVIAVVVGMDVEVVGADLKRIAGTGRYAEGDGKSIEDEGEVYRHALKTGRPVCIDNPKNDPICFNCKNREGCEEKLTLCSPILRDGKAIGIIGIICFTEQDKRTILKNRNNYGAFLSMMADLIAAKAEDYHHITETTQTLDVLRQVMDVHAGGMFVFGADGSVTYANAHARKELGIEDPGDTVSVQLIPTGNTVGDAEEYELHFGEQHLVIMGQMVDLKKDDPRFSRVMLFETQTDFTRKVSSLTSSAGGEGLDAILGMSPAIRRLKEQVMAITTSSSTVLISGKSGTGKELFARAIHHEGDRREQPFVAINCGAIPDTLLESELFGYTSGAFTGANPGGRIGKFELAHKGVLFLDEISSMPLYLQVKLLRVLQERKVERLGANKPIDVDIRVVAATNDDLPELIAKNMFRSDLYYRLNVIPLEIPPLCERIEDIDLLADHFLVKYSRRFSKRFKKIEGSTMARLRSYAWPGNVREFENIIEFMVNMMPADGVINDALLPSRILQNHDSCAALPTENAVLPLKEVEKRVITEAVARYGNDTKGKRTAATALGIGVATLYRKIREYGIE
ncbi:sigma 54-interacting transcriptional regulator [Desulfoluna sp.]|uniref:sigma-54 interaction domain-containing protein n=1 Tax=Desulfoluna sp. TaxID=2045199 RepID=UPI00260B1313|nr:sigma 54-interacting transcriptional regulator [Desulfoluna sp.]